MIIVWRAKIDGKLYSQLHQNQNIAAEKRYNVDGQTVSEIRIGLVALGAMTSCDLLIRSTTEY